MNARLTAVLLVSILVAPPLCEAGSGAKPGSGSKAGSGARPGSGTKDDPMAQLAGAVLEYRGKLTKGELNGNPKATMRGFFSLRDGLVFAESAPGGADNGSGSKPGSGSRAAAGQSPRFTLVALKSDSNAIGEYRLGRRGRLTLVFSAEVKGGSGKKKEGSDKKRGSSDTRTAADGSDKKKEGSDKRPSDYAAAPSNPLNGVMVLTHKKRKEGDYWVGKYREKEGKKTVRTWEIRVKPVSDPGQSA